MLALPALDLVTSGGHTPRIRPNRKWAANITYRPAEAGWVYLAMVLDLFSRKPLGWSVGDSIETTLVSEALHDAVKKRHPERDVLFHHSNRGC